MKAGPESKVDTQFEDTGRRWLAVASAVFSTTHSSQNTQVIEPIGINRHVTSSAGRGALLFAPRNSY